MGVSIALHWIRSCKKSGFLGLHDIDGRAFIADIGPWGLDIVSQLASDAGFQNVRVRTAMFSSCIPEGVSVHGAGGKLWILEVSGRPGVYAVFTAVKLFTNLGEGDIGG